MEKPMENLTMRPAAPADMPAVYDVYRTAIDHMNQNGIPQWDELYPTPAILDEDLARGELFVADAAGEVLAAVALNEQCDPAYDAAAWAYEGPWVIVHRLCVSPAAQGKGVGRGLMTAVEDWARATGYRAIRLDAFSLNPHALRMYAGLGFAHRGEANWRKGLFYLLEKRL
jgi:GNAT superfamily N-acetyltransferase